MNEDLGGCNGRFLLALFCLCIAFWVLAVAAGVMVLDPPDVWGF